jgi:MFS family permease
VLIVGDFGRALLLASIPIAYFANVLTLGHLYAVAFLVGILTVFFDVAYQSYLPALVEREHLVEGNSKLQVSASGAQTGGPGVGGVLIKVVGAPYAILVDIGSFLASALFAVTIHTRETPLERHAGERPGMRVELKEGLRYVLQNQYLRAIAACTALRNFFAAVGYAILLVYAVRALGLSVGLIGVIISCANVGFVIGALTTRWLTGRIGLGHAIVVSAAVVGTSIVLIPLAPKAFPVPLLVVGLMLYSYGGVVFNITQISLRQGLTPDRLQGRMNAVMRFILWGAIPLGALLGGVLATTIGLRAALWVSAGGAALSWLPVFFSPVRRVTHVPGTADDVRPEAGVAAAPTGVDTPGLAARAERAPADA